MKTETPEIIYAYKTGGRNKTGGKKHPQSEPAVKYIRADLMDKRIASLEEQIEMRANWMVDAVKSGEKRSARIIELERQNADLVKNSNKMLMKNRHLIREKADNYSDIIKELTVKTPSRATEGWGE